MVGVPGNSKGCSTCRRRKKGCDQRRPICGQCAQSGYECGGYNRDLTFITHPATKTVHKAYFLPYQQRSPLVTLSLSLDLSAIKYQCRGLVWDLYLPKGDCVNRDEFIVKCGHPTNWTEMVNGLAGDEISLQTAFSALSISRVGRENKDVRFVRESTKAYGKALRALQDALSNKNRAHSDEVLAACMILCFYELENSSKNALGWVSHAEGAARLIELRGPERHQKWQTHHIFLRARTPIIYAAMMRRNPTFLAQQSWLTTPWAIEHKTYFDRNIDMATQIPGLLHKIDSLQDQHTGDNFVIAGNKLLQHCAQLLSDMDKWHNGMKKGSQWALVGHESVEGDSYPFDKEISSPDHLFANAHITFWTCSLVLSDAIKELQALLKREARQVDDGRQTSGSRPSRQYAAQLAMSVPYFLQLEMGGLGANMLNFPVGMTYHFFHRSNEEHVCKWLKRVFLDAHKRRLNIGRTVNGVLEEQDLDRAMIGEDLAEFSSDTYDLDDKLEPVQERHSPDSGDESSDAPSPFSTSITSNPRTTWVYENPSKYYIEAS